MYQGQDVDSNKQRSEMLVFAQKAHAEKAALAKQLEQLKDKKRAFKSKLAAMEDLQQSLKQEVEATKERYNR